LPDNYTTVLLNTNLNNNKISKLKSKASIIFSIEPDKTNLPQTLNIPQRLFDKIGKDNLTLEALLTINNGVHLKIDILCYDQFSGSRKIFESNKYTKHSILQGYFDSKNTLDKSGLSIILDDSI
jgi:hypothetical protein